MKIFISLTNTITFKKKKIILLVQRQTQRANKMGLPVLGYAEWYQEACLYSSKFLTLQEGIGDLCTMYKHWGSDHQSQEKQPNKRLLHQVLQQLNYCIVATCNNCITDGKGHRNTHSTFLGHVLNN